MTARPSVTRRQELLWRIEALSGRIATPEATQLTKDCGTLDTMNGIVTWLEKTGHQDQAAHLRECLAEVESFAALRDAVPSGAPAEPRFTAEEVEAWIASESKYENHRTLAMLRELQRLLSAQTPAKGAPCFCPECGGDPTPQGQE